jgi:hypothetical protein
MSSHVGDVVEYRRPMVLFFLMIVSLAHTCSHVERSILHQSTRFRPAMCLWGFQQPENPKGSQNGKENLGR